MNKTKREKVEKLITKTWSEMLDAGGDVSREEVSDMIYELIQKRYEHNQTD